MAIYRKREEFKGGADADVELLIAAGDLPIGNYKLKDVPDCAIIAGYVRELETEEDVKASNVNQDMSPPAVTAPEPLPKSEQKK